MSFKKNRFKKLAILSLTLCGILSLSLTSVEAQDEQNPPNTQNGPTQSPGCSDAVSCLMLIASNTTNILSDVNQLPTLINKQITYIKGWMDPDTSDPSTTLQGDFIALEDAATQNQKAIDPKNGIPQKMAMDYFVAGGLFSTGDKTQLVTQDTLPTVIPQANDLTYQTLLGTPFLKTDPRKEKAGDTAYNYLRNASGISVEHIIPGSPGYDWGKGKATDKDAYNNYYNTVSAAQTYNAYILSELYADLKNGQQESTVQQTMIKDASDQKNWFQQIAAQTNPGIILKQILMFESQSFLYLVRSYKLQQKMLMTQAITNTLLISLNQQGEDAMVKRAIGAAGER